MKKNYTLIFLLAFSCSFLFAADPAQANSKLAEQPLLFTQNKGQVADMDGNLQPDILFTTHSNGVKLFLNKNGISYQFQKTEYPEGYDATDKEKIRTAELEKQIKTTTYRMDMELVGAKTNPVIKTDGKSEYFENFYLSHCPNGVLNVPTFTKITYKEVYPNIDWVIYTKGQEMKYDFIVHAGGDPSIIKVKYNGASEIKINDDESLLVTSPLGQVIDQKPVSFQNGTAINSNFELKNEVVTYRIGEYNKTVDLVIDPGLVWATYYGGSGGEGGIPETSNNNTAIDGNDNVYLGGTTYSNNNIASGGFLNTYSGNYTTAFLVKFNSSGNRLWGTYYGDDNVEAYGVATDLNSNVFLTGITYSTIPSGGFQNTNGGYMDAFLVKFNSAGGRLWATYYGGTGTDIGQSLATDGNGNIYLTGGTTSTAGIASGGYQVTHGGDMDAFLVKFNSSGGRVWGTYFGGSGSESSFYTESSNLVATDVNGNVYLTGGTTSTNNIASGGFQNTMVGSSDAFLVKFNSSGNKLWGTYYDGGGFTRTGTGVTTDLNGDVYFTGSAGCQCYGFLVKVNTTGSKLWEVALNGDGGDVVADANSNIYVSGATSYTTGVASGYQNVYGGGSADAFIAKFTNGGIQIGATYFGGTNLDKGAGMVVDNNGSVYLCGITASTTNIASGGFQNNYGGGSYDAFLAKFNACAFFGPTISPATITICPGQNTTLTTSGGATYQWSTGATIASISVAPTLATTYTVTITSSSGCIVTASRTVNIYSGTTASITADGVTTAIDTITSGDVVQLQLSGSLNANPNIQWTPNTALSNSSIANPFVYPSTTTTYTVTFLNNNGCTLSKLITIYVKPNPNIGTVSINTANGIISLFDTIVVNVQLTNVTGLYGLYMKLKGDAAVSTYLTYAGYTVGSLLGTGGSIISTPPVVTSGVYDFGITKIGAVQGYSGSGVFYTFKFVTKNVTIPNNTNFCFYLDNISAYNTSGSQVGLTNQGPYCYTFTDQLNVWPGDLNNSKTVTTADLLPIGYFYNSTGPARTNATIQWTAQPATLWGYGQTPPNGTAYKVFADSNGDGIISNADQTAIGFNIGKIHALANDPIDHHERALADGDILITATPSSINPATLPNTVTLQVALKNNSGLDALYGISFNLMLDSSVFDLSSATFDYTGSIFGATAGTDFLNIQYVTDSSISIGLTRYANAAINGNGVLCRITLQTKSTLPGSVTQTQVASIIDAANTQTGDPLFVKDTVLYIPVGTNTGLTATTADYIAIYPNPAKEVIYIANGFTQEAMRGQRIVIYNYQGQLVYETQVHDNLQSISTKPWGVSGLYAVEVRNSTGNIIANKKIVVE